MPRFVILTKLPFYGIESIKLKNKMRKLVKSTFGSADIRVIFTTGQRIGDMFRYKDTLPLLANSHIVYKSSCEACGATYIGKTRQRLSSRFLKGHLSGREVSEVLDHTTAFGPNHCFSLENVEILCSEANELNLKIKESLFIRKLKPILNGNIISATLNFF